MDKPACTMHQFLWGPMRLSSDSVHLYYCPGSWRCQHCAFQSYSFPFNCSYADLLGSIRDLRTMFKVIVACFVRYSQSCSGQWLSVDDNPEMKWFLYIWLHSLLHLRGNWKVPQIAICNPCWCVSFLLQLIEYLFKCLYNCVIFELFGWGDKYRVSVIVIRNEKRMHSL